MSIVTFSAGDKTPLTKNFCRYEFECPCGCTAQMVDQELAKKLQVIRDKLGKKLKVTSGYRCIKHNADPKVKGVEAAATFTALPQTGGRWIAPSTRSLSVSSHRALALAESASTGTAWVHLSTLTPGEVRPPGFVPPPVIIPAPATVPSSCRPSNKVALGRQTVQPRSCFKNC